VGVEIRKMSLVCIDDGLTDLCCFLIFNFISPICLVGFEKLRYLVLLYITISISYCQYDSTSFFILLIWEVFCMSYYSSTVRQKRNQQYIPIDFKVCTLISDAA
jgi:hypothetical protein